MSSRHSRGHKPFSTLDTRISNRDTLENVKEWLIFTVRLLSSHVSLRQSKNVWNKKNKPEWWDEKVGLAWKNPTEKHKDRKEDLVKKYLALKKYLISIDKFPEQVKEQDELWSKNDNDELFLLTEYHTLFNTLKTTHSSIAHFFQELKGNNSKWIRSSKNSLIECLKTFLNDFEKKFTESVGIKRHSSVDEIEINLLPYKKRKCEFFQDVPNLSTSAEKQNSKYTSVANSTSHQKTDKNVCHSASVNKILHYPDTAMPFKNIKKDYCNSNSSVRDFNLKTQKTTTVTTTAEDDNITPTFHEESGNLINKTDCFLNISSSGRIPLLNSIYDQSNSLITSEHVIPPRGPNCVPDNPLTSDLNLSVDPSDSNYCSLLLDENLVHKAKSPADFENISASVQLEITDVSNQYFVDLQTSKVNSIQQSLPDTNDEYACSELNKKCYFDDNDSNMQNSSNNSLNHTNAIAIIETDNAVNCEISFQDMQNSIDLDLFYSLIKDI